MIISQGKTLPPAENAKEKRAERMKEVRALHDEQVKSLDEKLSNLQMRTTEQNREKGASSWLSVLPLREQGFTLQKDEFRDCIALRYGDKIPNLPSKCACGETFDVNHAIFFFFYIFVIFNIMCWINDFQSLLLPLRVPRCCKSFDSSVKFRC